MSPGTRRLMKEAAELLTTPSPHFTASPVSDTNLYDWHFTLAGPPPPSPYANGIYHGRIVFPPTYPLRPPSFRFLTPSGRFEVNREICLSISGHHEETWQPAWGIRTALLAIRSFMDGDARGQVGGLDVADEVRRRYAGESRGWRCEVCGRGNEEILAEACPEPSLEGGEGEGEGEEGGVEEKMSTTTRDVSQEEEPVVSSIPQPEKEKREGVQQEQQQQQAVPVVSPVATPTPTPTTATTPLAPSSQGQAQMQAQTQSQPQPHPQLQPPSHSMDSPWLDRAIIGVLVALVLMILRRVARSEDY